MYARVQNYGYNSHNLVEKNTQNIWLTEKSKWRTSNPTQVSLAVWKFHFCHFVFTKDLHYYRFSLTKRNPKRIIAVMKKGKKWKVGFSLCFAVSRYRGRTHPQHWEWTHQAPSLRTIYSASQHQATTALNCICEHLCFIFICFVHLLARCIPR